MSSITNKRRLKDIKNLIKKNDVEDFWYYSRSLDEVLATIVGPKDTPYEGGFYFFKIKIPEQYPMIPPKVTYYTQGYNVRFNPNLYRMSHHSENGGKVCLSILNTWNIGPKWKPSWTLKTIMLAIQADVLVDNPLRNEPGYENSTSFKLEKYRDIVLHENYRTAVYGMLKHPPKDFEVFLPKMREYFIKNFNNYILKLSKYMPIYDGKRITCNVYSRMGDYNLNFKRLKERYYKIMVDLSKKSYEELEGNYIEYVNSLNKTEDSTKLIKDEPWLSHRTINMSLKLSELRKIAQLYNIESKVKIDKEGKIKIKNKSKSMLIEEINKKIKKLKSNEIMDAIMDLEI